MITVSHRLVTFSGEAIGGVNSSLRLTPILIGTPLDKSSESAAK